MKSYWTRIRRFLTSEDGPTATEYAILLALIALGLFVTMGTFGANVQGLYVTIRAAVLSV